MLGYDNYMIQGDYDMISWILGVVISSEYSLGSLGFV